LNGGGGKKKKRKKKEIGSFSPPKARKGQRSIGGRKEETKAERNQRSQSLCGGEKKRRGRQGEKVEGGERERGGWNEIAASNLTQFCRPVRGKKKKKKGKARMLCLGFPR